ncbi:MAG TPA: hypothetical protein PKD49_02890 [Hyphomicrobium sp.]|nr:hypothetical protein [Hyphomicrobium sp.]
MKNRHQDLEDLIGGSESDIPANSNRADLAALFGIKTRQIDVLLANKAIAREPNGQINTRKAIQGYVAFVRRSFTELEEQRIRQTKAHADKLEIANAQKRGELLEAIEVEQQWASILRDLRNQLLALPSRFSNGREIDSAIRKILNDLAQANDS